MLSRLIEAMPKRSPDSNRFLSEITDEEVVAVIDEQLPHWKLACDRTEADAVMLHQQAFGRSFDEVALMYTAIRYAGIRGKTVMIVPSPKPKS
jgi:hypothetical protein